MSSVDPTTMSNDGTIDVSAVIGKSNHAMNPTVQSRLVPAVSIGRIAPLGERIANTSVSSSTTIDNGTSSF
jgi:hypothetical protein